MYGFNTPGPSEANLWYIKDEVYKTIILLQYNTYSKYVTAISKNSLFIKVALFIAGPHL